MFPLINDDFRVKSRLKEAKQLNYKLNVARMISLIIVKEKNWYVIVVNCAVLSYAVITIFY